MCTHVKLQDSVAYLVGLSRTECTNSRISWQTFIISGFHQMICQSCSHHSSAKETKKESLNDCYLVPLTVVIMKRSDWSVMDQSLHLFRSLTPTMLYPLCYTILTHLNKETTMSRVLLLILSFHRSFPSQYSMLNYELWLLTLQQGSLWQHPTGYQHHWVRNSLVVSQLKIYDSSVSRPSAAIETGKTPDQNAVYILHALQYLVQGLQHFRPLCPPFRRRCIHKASCISKDYSHPS